MIGEIREAVAGCEPDLLVVSQIRAAPYADAVPDALLWLDQADVWSAFLDQEIAARHGLARSTARLQRRHIRRQEISWIQRAKVVTAAGYSDAGLLSRISGRDIQWLPTVVQGGEAPRPHGAPLTAGFFANFAFWPNRDAFALLRDEWAPVLRNQGWRVLVAGIGSASLGQTPGVDVIGEVSHPRDFYSQIDLALAPIRLGGGIKVKVVEALLWGRPVIGTKQAVDGLSPELANAIPIVARASELRQAVQFATENSKCSALAHERFSVDGFKSKVADLAVSAVGEGS